MGVHHETSSAERRQRQALGIFTIIQIVQCEFVLTVAFRRAELHSAASSSTCHPSTYMDGYGGFDWCPSLSGSFISQKKTSTVLGSIEKSGNLGMDFLINYPFLSLDWHVPDFEDTQHRDHSRMGKK